MKVHPPPTPHQIYSKSHSTTSPNQHSKPTRFKSSPQRQQSNSQQHASASITIGIHSTQYTVHYQRARNHPSAPNKDRLAPRVSRSEKTRKSIIGVFRALERKTRAEFISRRRRRARKSIQSGPRSLAERNARILGGRIEFAPREMRSAREGCRLGFSFSCVDHYLWLLDALRWWFCFFLVEGNDLIRVFLGLVPRFGGVLIVG